MDFISTIISALGNAYPKANAIYAVIGTVLTYLVFHRKIYNVIGFLFTRKFKPAVHKHKYGIVIAARNEEAVIGNLLDSIHKQDYPQELLTVFVVADNCTDNTAKVVREKGAVCYERFDSERKTKGFALQYLFERIEEDYGRKSFDGYFVFDADNLLKEDYISRMNDSFDAGEKIITSYRNTKNFTEGWVASTYALHWLRSIRANHRARSVLRLATNIQGTGFLFANEIVEKGWKYTSLTEDRALTADAVAQGYKISYNDKAEFYDEQPISLRVALRQRLRWSKGHLLAFAETGPYLFMNVIFGKLFIKNRFTDRKERRKKLTFKRFCLNVVENIRHRFASFDTLMQLTPISVFNVARWLIVPVFMYACYCYVGNVESLTFFGGGTYLAKLLRFLFPFKITLNSGYDAFLTGLLMQVWLRLLYRVGSYIEKMFVAVYLFIVEHKRIVKIPFHKKVLYTLTWPIFDIIGRYTTYLALFVKVTWKPIPHESKITIDDIEKSKQEVTN
jgi:cellulose synthase/poly-beta-1,6-N-acetylglucosamine synthase-like glycosyltransferase